MFATDATSCLLQIYYWKNQEFLRIKEHTEAQAKLQADWAGYIMRHGETIFNSWQVRFM